MVAVGRRYIHPSHNLSLKVYIDMWILHFSCDNIIVWREKNPPKKH